jgi:hypothetical protein
MPGNRIRIATVTVLTLVMGHLMTAHAQMPSTAQRNAIRQSCARDYQAMCANVPTGGSASLQCLRENMSSLSPACQSAVGAISSGGGQPSRPSGSPVAARPAQACRADFREFCGGIRPGGGRAIMCLREHAMDLSPTCQESLQAMRR